MAEGSKTTDRAWDRRPWPVKGNSDGNVLYASIGRALSQWERYESRLSILFAAFVAGDKKNNAARRSYVAVRTFEGRAEMLRAASSSYFEESSNTEMQEAFRDILRTATSYSPRRNDVAHGVVDYFLAEDLYRAGKTGIFLSSENQYALYPSWASYRERDIKGAPSYCMSSVEIDYFFHEFTKIVKPVMELTSKLLSAT